MQHVHCDTLSTLHAWPLVDALYSHMLRLMVHNIHKIQPHLGHSNAHVMLLNVNSSQDVAHVLFHVCSEPLPNDQSSSTSFSSLFIYLMEFTYCNNHFLKEAMRFKIDRCGHLLNCIRNKDGKYPLLSH